jgi:hypothetical protein
MFAFLLLETNYYPANYLGALYWVGLAGSYIGLELRVLFMVSIVVLGSKLNSEIGL